MEKEEEKYNTSTLTTRGGHLYSKVDIMLEYGP